MREMIDENNRYRNLLSKDLGAIAGLLFEVVSNRLVIEKNAIKVIDSERDKRTKANMKRHIKY